MKRDAGDWTRFRKLPDLVEVDFHWRESGPREVPYWEAMAEVKRVALDSLKDAHERGKQYVLFTHGASTSRPGNTTARSQVRGLIRSREATPYVIRGECIQHETVLVAAIRPKG